MAFVYILRKLGLLPAPSKFKVGDQVQLISGGPLMIVESVELIKKTGNYLIGCKWFDKETQSSRTNLFTQEQLKPFDWYNAH